MIPIAVLCFSLLMSHSAFAGDTKGQGGDILVCEKNGKTTYESFDLYERYNYRLELSFEPQATAAEIIPTILDRLQVLDPERACLYKTYLEGFAREARFEDVQPEPIDDEGLPIVPSHCRLEQVARQTTLPDQEGIKYRFYSPWFPS